MNEQIEKLKNLIIQELCPLIKSDYVLLDVPNHRNIGDLLIWEGELTFLRNYINYTNLYSANIRNCQMSKIPEGCTVLLHGGGNFGDLYPKHNEFRTEIINNFPNNKIIVFPQTVFFKNERKIEKDIEAINNHNNITICVRDNSSYDLLTKYIDRSKLLLLPDMAFFVNLEQLDSLRDTGSRQSLILNRTDYEGNMTNRTLSELHRKLSNEGFSVRVSDWPTFSSNRWTRMFMDKKDGLYNRVSIILQKTPLLKHLISAEFGLNSKDFRKKNIQLGVDFLNTYDRIYTTRLHGLIMSILLNKEVFILDNNYGKSKLFYEIWLKDFNNVKLIQE